MPGEIRGPVAGFMFNNKQNTTETYSPISQVIKWGLGFLLFWKNPKLNPKISYLIIGGLLILGIWGMIKFWDSPEQPPQLVSSATTHCDDLAKIALPLPDYKELEKTPDKFDGILFMITGKIVNESGDGWMYLAINNDDILYITYDIGSGVIGVKGDTVGLFGIFTGIHLYMSEANNKTEVPSIHIKTCQAPPGYQYQSQPSKDRGSAFSIPDFVSFDGYSYQKINFSELPLRDSKGFLKGTYSEGVIIRKADFKGKESALVAKDNPGTIAVIFPSKSGEKIENLFVGDRIAIYGFYLNRAEESDIQDWIKNISPTTSVIAGIVKILNKVPRPSPTPPPTPTPVNYNQFQSMHIADYAKNPPLYYGKQIKIRSAFIKDFLAAHDRGGDTNRIDVIDGHEQVIIPTEMIFNIDDNNLYQKVVSSLNKGDFINVYGIGEKSSDATGSLTGSQTFPVLKVLRIDKCDMSADTICETGSIETIFSQ